MITIIVWFFSRDEYGLKGLKLNAGIKIGFQVSPNTLTMSVSLN